MADLLSHPFRVSAAGTVATVRQHSDAAYAEELAAIALTVVGERPLVPPFGVPDPIGIGFPAAFFVGAVETYGPPVVIEDTNVDVVDDRRQEVTIRFEKV